MIYIWVHELVITKSNLRNVLTDKLFLWNSKQMGASYIKESTSAKGIKQLINLLSGSVKLAESSLKPGSEDIQYFTGKERIPKLPVHV